MPSIFYPLVKRYQDININRVGGKALNLFKLVGKFNIPRGLVNAHNYGYGYALDEYLHKKFWIKRKYMI